MQSNSRIENYIISHLLIFGHLIHSKFKTIYFKVVMYLNFENLTLKQETPIIISIIEFILKINKHGNYFIVINCIATDLEPIINFDVTLTFGKTLIIISIRWCSEISFKV